MRNVAMGIAALHPSYGCLLALIAKKKTPQTGESLRGLGGEPDLGKGPAQVQRAGGTRRCTQQALRPSHDLTGLLRNSSIPRRSLVGIGLGQGLWRQFDDGMAQFAAKDDLGVIGPFVQAFIKIQTCVAVEPDDAKCT